MPQPKDEEAAQRCARAERLRQRIEGHEEGTVPPAAPETPNDFVERRMRELDDEEPKD